MIRFIIIIIICAFIVKEALAQEEIRLWSRRPPGSIVNKSVQERSERGEDGILRIRDVTDPTITVFHPSDETNNGAAVIICPGGGYQILAFEKEGTMIAQWLANNGITGVVLKYRLPDATIMENMSLGPLDDFIQAMKIVKKNAREWGVDNQKIGVMGFSAGGHLAASASTLLADHKNVLPDFSILIYPVISMKDSIGHRGSRNNLLGLNPTIERIHDFSLDEQVTEDTPPAFIVHASDDKAVLAENSVLYYRSLLLNNIPAELHLYQTGGHGFGKSASGTHASWPEQCLMWMKARGLLEKKVD